MLPYKYKLKEMDGSMKIKVFQSTSIDVLERVVNNWIEEQQLTNNVDVIDIDMQLTNNIAVASVKYECLSNKNIDIIERWAQPVLREHECSNTKSVNSTEVTFGDKLDG